MAYAPKNIQPTVPYGGGSVMIWGCISHDCKLDLVTVKGNLTGDQYICQVLEPVVVPHFDNHPLATRPQYMDDCQASSFPGCDGASPEQRCDDFALARHEPRSESPGAHLGHSWPSYTETGPHPPVQNLRELEAALHREWLLLLLRQKIRHLTGRVRSRLEVVIRARGGYTKY
ncbi:uncharacterized protein LOC121389762 [Gigantopelta aegis]|uniref:uncharacterized protein LOC121389762 n=1 Tax=Gigantopelta aegis TaxID=1735272 RepID=UPI001B889459|nr:uncharacterized protein LOC121389762 [Gigantopelta aegis]